MNKVRQAWLDYRDKIYPHEISAVQEKECGQAFCAGFGLALESLAKLSEQNEDTAVESLKALTNDGIAAMASYLPNRN